MDGRDGGENGETRRLSENLPISLIAWRRTYACPLAQSLSERGQLMQVTWERRDAQLDAHVALVLKRGRKKHKDNQCLPLFQTNKRERPEANPNAPPPLASATTAT